MTYDIHVLSGAYAVDALDEQEREAFERHLAGCESCKAEVDGLREAAASLAHTVTLTPPAHLRGQVLDNIAAVRPLPPVLPISPRRPTRRGWLQGALLAAAVVALLLVWVHPQTSSNAPNVSAADQIVRAQDAVSVSQHLSDGATVVWYRSKKLNAAAVSVADLPTPAAGKTYELWLQSSNGTMRPAGLLQGGSTVLALNGPARSAIGAGLTLEPDGGSKTPTLPAVTLVAFPST